MRNIILMLYLKRKAAVIVDLEHSLVILVSFV